MNELLASLSIDAALLAETLESLPARLRRKLDAEPELAVSWDVRAESGGSASSVFVDAGDDVVVTLDAVDGVIRDVAALRCSCLLAPGCLHRGAVAVLLAVATEPVTGEVATGNAIPDPGASGEVSVSALQRAAARAVWVSAAPIVTQGITMSGALQVASLLRAANLCRNEGMHVLARAAIRMVEHIKRRGANEQSFSLAEACDDLRVVLRESWLVMRDQDGLLAEEGMRSGRRQFADGGGLRLVAMACEPVVAASGFSGVVTYLVDGEGNTFHLADVMPGGISQVRAKYQTAVRVGETTITHENLSRSGLVISGATVAPDGRLGAGQSVRAAPLASAPDKVVETGQTAFDVQTLRRNTLRALTNQDRTQVFEVRAVIVGAAHNALVCVVNDDLTDSESEQLAVRVVPSGVHPDLSGLSNLRLLARCVGMPLTMVCTVVPNEHPTLRVLSFMAVDPEHVAFPQGWRGRCNVGIDRLEPGMFRYRAEPDSPVPLPGSGSFGRSDPHADPHAHARRAVERVAAIGTVALHNAAQDVVRTAALLERNGFRNGSRLFEQLLRLSASESRETDGRLRPAPVERSACAWLACAEWDHELRLRLATSAWEPQT